MDLVEYGIRESPEFGTPHRSRTRPKRLTFVAGDDVIQRGGELGEEVIAETNAALFIPADGIIHLSLNETVKRELHAWLRLP